MAEKAGKKRERCANYSPNEKSMLVNLVSKYKHIVEDKRITAPLMKKKREAWKEIASKFNSKATTGFRQAEQLKVLYDNIKQKSRKKSWDTNVQTQKSTGEVLRSQSTDRDSKTTLTGIRYEVDPLSKPHDSEEEVFKDDDNQPTADIIDSEGESELLAEIKEENNSDIEIDEHNIESEYSDRSASTSPVEESITTAHPQHTLKRGRVAPSPPRVTITRRTLQRKEVPRKDHVTLQNKVSKPKSLEDLKKMYYIKKMENAALERKKLLIEISNVRKEHNLKMMVFKKQLDKLNIL